MDPHLSPPLPRPAALRHALLAWRRGHRRLTAVAVVVVAAAVAALVWSLPGAETGGAEGGALRHVVTAAVSTAALVFPLVTAVTHVATARRRWPRHLARAPRLIVDVFRAVPGSARRVVGAVVLGLVAATYLHPPVALGLALGVLALAPTDVGRAVAEARIAGHIARARVSGRTVRTDASRWLVTATAAALAALPVAALRLFLDSAACGTDALLGAGCPEGGALVLVAGAAVIGAVAVTPLALATGGVLARVLDDPFPTGSHPVPSHVEVLPDDGEPVTEAEAPVETDPVSAEVETPDPATPLPVEDPHPEVVVEATSDDDPTDDPTVEIAPIVATADGLGEPPVADPEPEEQPVPDPEPDEQPVADPEPEPVFPEPEPIPEPEPEPVFPEPEPIPPFPEPDPILPEPEPGPIVPDPELVDPRASDPVAAAAVESETEEPAASEDDADGSVTAPPAVQEAAEQRVAEREPGAEREPVVEPAADLPPLFGSTPAPVTHPVDRAMDRARPRLEALSEPTRGALVSLFASVARTEVDPEGDALEQLSGSLRDVPLDRTRRAISVVRANTGKVDTLRSQYQRSPRIAKGAIERAAVTGLRAAGLPGGHADTVARTLLAVDAEDWAHLTGVLDDLDDELTDG